MFPQSNRKLRTTDHKHGRILVFAVCMRQLLRLLSVACSLYSRLQEHNQRGVGNANSHRFFYIHNAHNLNLSAIRIAEYFKNFEEDHETEGGHRQRLWCLKLFNGDRHFQNPSFYTVGEVLLQNTTVLYICKMRCTKRQRKMEVRNI